MRVLVTGANGFVGGVLCRKLVSRGYEVRALVRATGDRKTLEGLAVEFLEGDVTDFPSLRAAARGSEIVFHLAGIRRAPSRKQFFRVNAEGTRNLCEAMLEARARRLVLCGSLAAAGPSTPSQPKTESDPLEPTEWYGESKAEAERVAMTYADQLEIAIARPARILGPGDRENLLFFKLARRGVRLVIAGGPRPLSMVDVEDVAELLLLLAQKREAVGQAFFVAGPEQTTLEGVLASVAETLGIHTRTVYVPKAVLHGLGAAADVVSRVTGAHLGLNRNLARQLLAPAWTCSTEKARQLLDFRPTTSLEDSIKRSTAWYQRAGWI
jgi:nucleoside-diphosphate-sugar epimerase